MSVIDLSPIEVSVYELAARITSCLPTTPRIGPSMNTRASVGKRQESSHRSPHIVRPKSSCFDRHSLHQDANW